MSWREEKEQWERRLAADPDDVRALQKLGELHLKRNEPSESARHFLRVAEVYAKGGFFLKAVAVAKQVLKLDPTRGEVTLFLADLHVRLGLEDEAAVYFQRALRHSESEEGRMPRDAITVLRKYLDLAPRSWRHRLYLADLLLLAAQPSDARIALEELARLETPENPELAKQAERLALELAEGHLEAVVTQLRALRRELDVGALLEFRLADLDFSHPS